MSAPHPFDPISAAEIRNATTILKASFPDVKLRFKLIDVNEPIKKDVIPYIEAERLGNPLPPPPARIIQALFHSKNFFSIIITGSAKRLQEWIRELS